jgi:hypothetical protein
MRCILLVCALFPVSVLADGVMFRRTEIGSVTGRVDSPAQEAVLIVHESAVCVVLRTHFSRGPREVAWLVPAPAEPKNVERDSDEVFAKLDALTAPRFYSVQVAGKKSTGCGCAASKDEAASIGGVTVKSTGSAGIFNYSVLTATSADDLLKWLGDNQFAIPTDARDVMQRYVELKWHWLALKLRPGVGDTPTLAPHPVRYTYASKDVVFPLVISRPSAAARNQITLYVIALDQFAPANWPAAQIARSEVRRDPSALSGTNYETLFDAATRNGAFVTEYARRTGAQSLPDGLIDATTTPTVYLTRLRTVVSPAAMDRDVVLRRARQLRDVSNGFELQSRSSVVEVISGNVAMIGIPSGALMMLKYRRRIVR